MKNILHTILAMSLILISPYLSAQEQERYSEEYKIGPKDLLDISVVDMEELGKTVRVSEDGKITLPLLGEIEVEGLTRTEVEQRLSQLLEEKYLQNPQVTVFISAYQSKRVLVLGAVGNAGSHELLGRRTLLQMLSLAGGIGENAGDEIIVIRQYEDGTSKSLKISRDDLILRGDSDLNIPLRPDDVVNIPVDRTAKIYVFGRVKSPGALEVKKSNIPTLLRAIAQAGGFDDRAKQSGVVIKRTDEEGREIQIKVNVKDIIKGRSDDIQLKENDVIYVPESLF